MSAKLIIFAATLTAWLSPVWAAPRTLTYAECLEIAENNNQEIKAARAKVDAAEAVVRGSYAAFFPKLSADFGFARAGERKLNQRFNLTNAGSYAAALNSSINLFNGFEDVSRIDLTRTVEKKALTGLRAARANVSFNLKSAFARLLYATRSVKLTSAILERRERNAQLVQLRYESGQENKGNLSWAQVALDAAKLDLIQAQNELVVANADMAKALGITSDEGFEATGQVPTVEAPTTVDFESVALETPERQQALWVQEEKQAEMRIARSGFLPDINFNVSAGRFGPDWFPQDEAWTVGVSLTLPLFSFAGPLQSFQAARAELSSATYTRQAVELGLVAKLKQLHVIYVQASLRQKLDVQFLDAAQIRAEITRRRYENGLTSFEDWDVIETELINREKNALASQRDRIVAEAEWERALGRGAL